jgi:hypothetical protein
MLPVLTNEQITQFHEDGFLVVENLLDEELVNRLVERFEPLFSGEFETGVYPDGWHWNPYLGLPNSTRQITGNVWKSDLTFASVILSERIGHICAMLGGWNGARLLGDGLWVKPYGASETPMHRDLVASYYTPEEMVGTWIALSDAIPGASTIEFVKGSHQWLRSQKAPKFRVGNQALEEAAKLAGVEHPEVSQIQLKPGSCTFHHGDIWHGSGRNVMPGKTRRSLTLDHISAEARFKSRDGYVPDGYNAGRYRRYGDDSMDESFFPIVWRQDGYRSPFLADYCDDALAKTATLVGG